VPRPSTIERLDNRIREAVDAAVRGGATIDEIVETITELGGDASRSAVGRYVKRTREQMERYRHAREMAKAWIGRLEADPEGDVGRLLAEMLRTVAWQQLATMGETDEVDTNEIMLLARAIKDLASADKTAADRELRVRREVAKEAAATAEKTARAKGLDQDTIALIKASILGLERAA